MIDTNFASFVNTLDLCLSEKVEIAKHFRDPRHLNKKSDIALACKHRSPFLLCNHKS